MAIADVPYAEGFYYGDYYFGIKRNILPDKRLLMFNVNKLYEKSVGLLFSFLYFGIEYYEIE